MSVFMEQDQRGDIGTGQYSTVRYDYPNIAPVPSIDPCVAVLLSIMSTRWGFKLVLFHQDDNSWRVKYPDRVDVLMQHLISASVRGCPSISATSCTPDDWNKRSEIRGAVMHTWILLLLWTIDASIAINKVPPFSQTIAFHFFYASSTYFSCL